MADAVAGDFKRARLGSVSTGNVERASFCNNNNNNNPQESQKNCGETEASAAHKMPTAETEDSCQGNGCGSQTGCCCCCAGGRENNSQRKGPPHLRVGLLGCGWFSRRAHVPALLKLERRSAHSLGLSLQIEAICSRSQASLDAVSKLLNDGKRRRDIRQYTSQSAFLADPAVDVVIVALPIPIQCAAIEAAWKAGKHVISEKPAASSVAAAARLWAAMQEDLSEKGGGCAGKMWCVLENWAYKPGVSRVSKLLRAGSVGEVARFVYVCYNVVVVLRFKAFFVNPRPDVALEMRSFLIHVVLFNRSGTQQCCDVCCHRTSTTLPEAPLGDRLQKILIRGAISWTLECILCVHFGNGSGKLWL